MSLTQEQRVSDAIAANTRLLDAILRLAPDLDVDQMVPCSNSPQQRCPMLASYTPITVTQALHAVQTHVKRLQHALGIAQLLGAHEWDLAGALGDCGQHDASSEMLEALVPDQR